MGVELVVGLSIALGLLALGALALAVRARRRGALGEGRAEAWARFRSVADEVGGLEVVPDGQGGPRLRGIVEGVTVEIDGRNPVGGSREPRLGLRCHLPVVERAPNAAIWIGEVPALRMEFGRPRPLGDPDGLFEVHTRAEPTASDWWHEPLLLEALLSLPGAGLLLVDGDLTVVFGELDAASVRTALEVPGLLRRGVRRVTLH